MIGTMLPTSAAGPNHWRKDDYRKQKKDSSDFEPHNSAHAAERAQETAHTLGNTPAGLGCSVRRGCNGLTRINSQPRPGLL
jgi:hypothetical protein